MDSPERQAQMHKDALIKEHTKITRDLKRLPFEYIDEYLALDTFLSGVNHEPDIKEVKSLYNNYIKKLIKR